MIGAIDDIRIYNRALSESEIQELYRERSGPSGLITIDFDALPGMPNGPGLAVPLGSRLSNQLQPTTGAVFSSAAGYVAVVDLNAADPNHAISAPNGIGGVNASGQLSYGTPITVTFFEPGNPLVPAVSNFIQIRGDQIPLSGATATLEAFDVFGSSLGAITAHDATGGLTLTLSVPGIHAARISQNSAAFGFDGTIAFDNLTFSLEGLVVVSDLVSFEPIRSTYQFTPTPTGCPAGFVGTFSFDARLTNTSESSVSDLVVMVTTLTNGNLLQNADGGPAGVGARLTVPQQEGFTDGVLTPDEFVHVPFIICLQEQERFIFMVDVLGLAAEP